MTITEQILFEKGFRRDPNATTILFNNSTLPIGTTWRGKYRIDVIPTGYGFKLFEDHGRLCAPTEIQFPKYATEDNYYEAFNRMNDFCEKNYPISHGLPAYLWGE